MRRTPISSISSFLFKSHIGGPGPCLGLIGLPCLLLCLCFGPLASSVGAQNGADGSALRVVQQLPQGFTERLGQVVVRFSHDMRPLGAMEQDQADSPLVLTSGLGPLPEGQLRWLDTKTLAYLFTRQVDRPLELEARVLAGTRSLSGAVLEKTVQWTMHTRSLELRLADPEQSLGRADAVFRLDSNYPLDAEQLRQSLRLTLDADGRSIPIRKVVDLQAREEPVHWRRIFRPGHEAPLWRYMIETGGELPGRSALTLRLGPKLRLADKSELSASFTFALRSYDSLAVTELRIFDSLGNIEVGPQLPEDAGGRSDAVPASGPDSLHIPTFTRTVLRFNNPVPVAELKRHMSCGPENPQLLRLLSSSGPDRDESRQFEIYSNWKPQTRYTVIIGKELRDSYGTSLGRDIRLELQSGDYPLDFAMPGPYLLLEEKLHGLFPINFTNIGRSWLRVNTVPWAQGGYAALLPELTKQRGYMFDELDPDPAAQAFFDAASCPDAQEGAVERLLLLDDDSARNKSQSRIYSLPDLLARGAPPAALAPGAGALPGAVEAGQPGSGPDPGAVQARSASTALPGPVRIEALIPVPKGKQRPGYPYLLLDPETGRPSEQGQPHRSHVSYVHEARWAAHLKSGRDSGLAWVTEMDTGAPGAHLSVFVRDSAGRALWQGRTDKDGLVQLPGRKRFAGNSYFFTVEKDGHSSVLPFATSPLASKFGNMLEREPTQRMWRAWLLGQMPLYKPGERVRYTVFVREFRDEGNSGENDLVPGGAWMPINSTPFLLEIHDSRGKIVHSENAASGIYGSFSGECELSPDAALGEYRFLLKSGEHTNLASGQAFRVASFRPPDFTIDLQAPRSGPKQFAEDQPLRANLSASYFSGPELKLTPAVLDMRGHSVWYSPQALAGFNVGIRGAWDLEKGRLDKTPGDSPDGDPVQLHTRLDDSGRGSFILPPVQVLPGRPKRMQLTATVTDAADLAGQATSYFMLHPAALYIGLKAPSLVGEGELFRLQYKAASFDPARETGGEPKVIFLTAVRRHVEKDDKGKTREIRRKLWSFPMPLRMREHPEGDFCDLRFVLSGTYELWASVFDAEGRENQSRMEVLVAGKDSDAPGGLYTQFLELQADAPSYKPGDSADIVVKNHYGQGTALLTVERENIRSWQLLELSGPQPRITVPISDKDAPYVFVSLTIIRGRNDLVTPSRPGEQGTRDEVLKEMHPEMPSIRFGRIRLDVDVPKPTLALELTSDKDEYRPGSELRARVRVSERMPSGHAAKTGAPGAGTGQKAQVTFLAVDERVLSAAGNGAALYDAARIFTPEYSCGVESRDSRTMLRNLRMYMRGKDFSAPDTIMGLRQGGGSAEYVARQRVQAAKPAPPGPLDQLREDFSPAVFWLAQGESDASGLLECSFRLPDSLTGYRLVAVATDARGRFASAQRSVTANKAIQLLSALPGFVVAGDSLEARVLVQNRSGAAARIRVEADAAGMRLDQGRAELALAPGESRIVSFAAHVPAEGPQNIPRDSGGTAPAGGRASLKVRAMVVDGDEGDSAVFSLPVLPRRRMTLVAASGMLRQGQRYALPLALPENSAEAAGPQAGLTLSLSASPAVGLSLAAEEVLRYPWNCLEQRASRAFVRVLRLRHGALLGLAAVEDDMSLLRDFFTGLSTSQTYSGAYSLWPGMYGGDDLFLTAYVLLVSREARALNLGLDQASEGKALDFLREELQLRYPDEHGSSSLPSGVISLSLGEKTERPPTSPESEAFALWLLVREHREEAVVLLRRMLDKLERYPGHANALSWALLLRVAAELEDGDRSGQWDAMLARCMTGLDTYAVITPLHMHFASGQERWRWRSFASELRDNAMILALLSSWEGPLPSPDPLYAGFREPYRRLDTLAAWLGSELGHLAAISTQDGAMGVWGLVCYLEKAGRALDEQGPVKVRAVWQNQAAGAKTLPDFTASFTKILDPAKLWSPDPAALWSAGAQADLLISAERGASYWSARLQYPEAPRQGSELLDGQSAGFTVLRSLKFKEPPRAGDIVEATITILVPQQRNHVLVFDPLPAGFEPLHATRTDLAATRDLLDRGAHWQWIEHRADAVLLYAVELQPGVYTYTQKLRAVTPGVFLHRAPRVEEMYGPGVFGRGKEQLVEVLGK
ncbi:hypothetical protein LJC59_02075 [Desulfovibrio sp. OttesenSCG-928-A18]|nr:hypothetical protein [Desulfovibrio sp. OttesenSCG-928-A18]